MEFVTGFLTGMAVSAWYWVVFAIALYLLAGFIMDERGFASSLMTILTGALVVLKWPVLIDYVTNPVAIGGVIIGYAVIGVVWARFHWGKYLGERVDRILTARTKYEIRENLPEGYLKSDKVTANHVRGFEEYLSQYHSMSTMRVVNTLAELYKAVTPSASKCKGAIVMWIAYWPASMALFVLRDMLRDFGLAIYRIIGGQFQKVADKKFSAL